jgi:hypothetical protein
MLVDQFLQVRSSARTRRTLTQGFEAPRDHECPLVVMVWTGWWRRWVRWRASGWGLGAEVGGGAGFVE